MADCTNENCRRSRREWSKAYHALIDEVDVYSGQLRDSGAADRLCLRLDDIIADAAEATKRLDE